MPSGHMERQCFGLHGNDSSLVFLSKDIVQAYDVSSVHAISNMKATW